MELASILLFIAFMTLEIADIYLTKRVLALGGVEKNKLMQKLIMRFPNSWHVIKGFSALVLISLLYAFVDVMGFVAIVGILSLVLGSVVYKNYKVFSHLETLRFEDDFKW